MSEAPRTRCSPSQSSCRTATRREWGPTFLEERCPLESDSSEPIPQIEQPPPPQRPRWWSFRRPWLPLFLAVLFASGETFVTLTRVQERRDVESKIVATEKRMRDLREEVDDQAHEIGFLDEQVGEALGIGDQCTRGAEMGVEVLSGLIQALELGSQGESLQASKAFVDMVRLAKEVDRITNSCVLGLRGLRREEAQLL